MYKGQLEGFPQEVVEKMLEEQVKQGNKRDVSVFEKRKTRVRYSGGFTWRETEAGETFWAKVINTKDFDLFFERYPKQPTFKRGDKILIWDTDGETPEERIALTYIELATYPVMCVAKGYEDNFINGEIFESCSWKSWALPQQQVTEVTMEEIAEKFGIDISQLKIKK